MVSLQQQSACTLNANGFYGTPQGISYQVTYAYQVVVRNGTTETMVSDNVAPVLDAAIAQDLLPYFFVECAPSSARRRRRLTRQQKNKNTRRRRQAEQTAGAAEAAEAAAAPPPRQFDADASRRYLQQGSPTVLGVSRLQSDFPVSGGTCSSLMHEALV
jgi:hypothetical protein